MDKTDKKEDAVLKRGMMLVAMPALLDPNFRQTVVWLCDHSSEGAMGLVINRPTTVPLSTVYPEAVKLYGREDPLYVGGPVQTDALMILYQGEPIPTARPVSQDVHLTGDLHLLQTQNRVLESDSRIRFYLGYAGWAPGQLETELRSGAWRLLPGDSNIIFQEDPLRVWPRMIQTLGQEWAVYADMPPDPRLN
ncbi:MAG TPA: YqgE/AlgH family protein [Nitrospiria bacterium]|nr:YqgE/AlgH family protein [Nitrospiria bacterium]